MGGINCKKTERQLCGHKSSISGWDLGYSEVHSQNPSDSAIKICAFHLHTFLLEKNEMKVNTHSRWWLALDVCTLLWNPLTNKMDWQRHREMGWYVSQQMGNMFIPVEWRCCAYGCWLYNSFHLSECLKMSIISKKMKYLKETACVPTLKWK